MGNAVNKFLSMFNMGQAEMDEDVDEVVDIDTYDDSEDEIDEHRSFFGIKTQKSTTTLNNQIKMSIVCPHSTDDAYQICDLLREKKSIVLNLEYVNKDVQRRIVDIVSGAGRVLDGNMQKVSQSGAIFVVVPNNYDLDSDMEEENNKTSYKFRG